MDPYSTKVAQAVREAAEAQGVSQLALSEATGIARATLLRRLNGHTSFTVDELSRIANHLGVHAVDLLGNGDAA